MQPRWQQAHARKHVAAGAPPADAKRAPTSAPNVAAGLRTGRRSGTGADSRIGHRTLPQPLPEREGGSARRGRTGARLRPSARDPQSSILHPPSSILLSATLLILLAAPLFTSVRAQDDTHDPLVWFGWVDIYIDAGDQPLAAYQFELAALAGEFEIVGVEGGEHAAFSNPPYYDPAALSQDRIIIAAYSLAADLPAGPTRVARVHVQVTGDLPQYTIELAVAAAGDGTAIDAAASVEPGASHE